MSVVHTVTRNHVEVIIRAAADCGGQGSFFCSGVDDCRLRVENERHRRRLCCPHPPRSKKKPSLDRKALKRTLQNCGRDPEV